ncbi:MAG: hypothetical protein D6680_15545 [Cyanobacteria bacterium J007]|nr:MAG: hypothetical protein D6680_15545 [Cyanobacteria bacterium J007]
MELSFGVLTRFGQDRRRITRQRSVNLIAVGGKTPNRGKRSRQIYLQQDPWVRFYWQTNFKLSGSSSTILFRLAATVRDRAESCLTVFA